MVQSIGLAYGHYGSPRSCIRWPEHYLDSLPKEDTDYGILL